MRFLGLGLSDRVPDARTIWLFREKLTEAGSIGPLFERFDAMLRQSGYIAMSGQIIDASLIAAPRQRNTEDEKKAIRQGRVPDNWKDKPAKLDTSKNYCVLGGLMIHFRCFGIGGAANGSAAWAFRY